MLGCHSIHVTTVTRHSAYSPHVQQDGRGRLDTDQPANLSEEEKQKALCQRAEMTDSKEISVGDDASDVCSCWKQERISVCWTLLALSLTIINEESFLASNTLGFYQNQLLFSHNFIFSALNIVCSVIAFFVSSEVMFLDVELSTFFFFFNGSALCRVAEAMTSHSKSFKRKRVIMTLLNLALCKF